MTLDGSGFLDMTKSMNNNKIDSNKLNFMKLKHFCTSKSIVKMMKRQSTEWGENICKFSVC